MKHTMYSIFDVASGLYSHPVYEQSDKAAIRSFGNIATSAESNVGLHPEDYTLFRLGIFDDQNGKLVNEDNEALCTALECVAKSKSIVKDPGMPGLLADNIEQIQAEMAANGQAPLK